MVFKEFSIISWIPQNNAMREMGKTGIITPILKMATLRLREVTCCIQGQDCSFCQYQALLPVFPT